MGEVCRRRGHSQRETVGGDARGPMALSAMLAVKAKPSLRLPGLSEVRHRDIRRAAAHRAAHPCIEQPVSRREVLISRRDVIEPSVKRRTDRHNSYCNQGGEALHRSVYRKATMSRA